MRTLVVSWKLAAEMKLSDWTAALVMPRSCVLAAAGLGRIHSAFLLAGGVDPEVLLLEVVARDDVADAEIDVCRGP